jgi:hypothetical protein
MSRGIFFSLKFFYGIFPENVVLFGIFEVLEEFWQGPEDLRIRGVIELFPPGIEE